MRYGSDDTEEERFRLVCSSRNLTHDRAWDVVINLEDRRAIELTITDAGRQAVHAWQATNAAALHLALSTLPARVRRAGADAARFADAVAPALLVAQAIGRIGELLQPGAVRPAVQPAVGAGDRTVAPPGRVSPAPDVPADLPVRADLRPGGWQSSWW